MRRAINLGANITTIFPPVTSPTSTSLLPLPLNRHKRNAVIRSEKTMANPVAGDKRQYWLLKTEPAEWSWADQAANDGRSKWDGVKNKQAQKHLKSMKLGDRCFFYHSGAKARRVVGVVAVAREWYSSVEDEVVVDVEAVGEMREPVDLKEMKKGMEGMKNFALFRQPRLSVVPVAKEIWDKICELGGGFEGDGTEGGHGSD
uniref:EVE domain-containing protein n=3 Tax=Cucumis melo TaxID=3656 RepID=A0A1S4E0I6_CUCME|nr:hypothetical protein [Cucumis melo subsp. melo]